MIENIGTLASVYNKPPEAFVKKLRDSQNQKELDENDDDLANEEAVDSTGQQIGSYKAEIRENDYEIAVKNKGKAC